MNVCVYNHKHKFRNATQLLCPTISEVVPPAKRLRLSCTPDGWETDSDETDDSSDLVQDGTFHYDDEQVPAKEVRKCISGSVLISHDTVSSSSIGVHSAVATEFLGPNFNYVHSIRRSPM